MSLSTSTSRYNYTGNGSVTAFAIPILIYDTTHIQVYLAGVLQSSGYTVTGTLGDPAGMTVNFTTPPGSSVAVSLLRVTPITQLISLPVAGAFPAKTVEKALDLTVMADQQFNEVLARAVVLPVSSTLTAATIPDPGLAANFGRGLKIHDAGLGIDTYLLSATPFTSPLTTKGDIAVFGSVAGRLPVGIDNTVLVSDSLQTLGVRWSSNLGSLTITSPIFSGTCTGTYTLGGTPSITAPIITGIANLQGGQILFPATQVPSADPNTLDDYEEGTWTPSIGGTATYTRQDGWYIKIGRLVTFGMNLTINALGTGSTSTISGLPFALGSARDCAYAIGPNTVVATAVVSLRAQSAASTSTITLAGRTAASVSSETTTNIIGSGTAIMITGSYSV